MRTEKLIDKQRGATAIEFALVFPMLFVLFYSVIVYSYIFVLQESISYAAQEAAAAAHQVNPEGMEQSAFDLKVKENVCPRLLEALAWLSADQQTSMGISSETCVTSAVPTGSEGQGGTFVQISNEDVVTVTARLKVDGIFPSISFPVIGAVPPLPKFLLGSGTAFVGGS